MTSSAAVGYAKDIVASKGAAFLPIAEQILNAKAGTITWHASYVQGDLMTRMCVIPTITHVEKVYHNAGVLQMLPPPCWSQGRHLCNCGTDGT